MDLSQMAFYIRAVVRNQVNASFNPSKCRKCSVRGGNNEEEALHSSCVDGDAYQLLYTNNNNDLNFF